MLGKFSKKMHYKRYIFCKACTDILLGDLRCVILGWDLMNMDTFNYIPMIHVKYFMVFKKMRH